MHVHYTGKPEGLTQEQQKALEARYHRLGQMLDGRGEREAHVILHTERHLHVAEITVNWQNHSLVSTSVDSELCTALYGALDRLEKQVQRLKEKRRDSLREHRDKFRDAAQDNGLAAAAPKLAASQPTRTAVDVYEYQSLLGEKPMTLDEAAIEMESGRDYFVYHDCETKRLSVLLRRRDGHLDLITC